MGDGAGVGPDDRCRGPGVAATDTEPRLTVLPGTVMLSDPPVRVKVVVVVPVVAALAMPGSATSTRVAPTRAVRPARSVFIDVPFWSVVKRWRRRIPLAAGAGAPSYDPVSACIGFLRTRCCCLVSSSLGFGRIQCKEHG